MDRGNANIGLFKDFPTNRVLEAFAGLNESCNRRVASFRPACLSAQQAAVACRDQYDNRRVYTRKYLAAAF